jgi:hypothetical protein
LQRKKQIESICSFINLYSSTPTPTPTLSDASTENKELTNLAEFYNMQRILNKIPAFPQL